MKLHAFKVTEKTENKHELTSGAWLVLAFVKIFSLMIALCAIAGVGLLCLRAGLFSCGLGVLEEVGCLLAVLAVIEGAPKLGMKLHDRLLDWHDKFN